MGCVSAPEQSSAPEVDEPAQWTANSITQQGSPTAWLNDFNDPALNKLVSEALQNNPSLQITAARLNQAIAEARIAGADLMPSANLGLDASRRQINSFGPANTGNTRFEDYGLNLNVSWELDIWGKVRDRTSAALAQVDASNADLQSARQSLAAQVVKSWFNYVEAEAQLALAQDTAEAYSKNTQTLEARFKRGLSEGLDLRRLRTQAAGSHAAVETRRRGRDQAARSLEIVLGRYPSAQLEADTELAPLPAPVPVGIPSELIYRRPDLRAAERRLAATDKELLAAQKELLPSIALTASGGNSSQEFKDIFNSNFFAYSIAGNLSQPVFQGGRIRANIDRSASLSDQALLNYRDRTLVAFLEVETTLAAETYLKSEYAKLFAATEEAIAAESLAWSKYRNGTTSFINALDTQRTANTARSTLLTVRNLLLQNRVDLYLALGGPFDESI